MASQLQLAEFIGVRQPTISRILRGATIGPKVAKKIAKRLNNGVGWNEVLVMDPDDIRQRLEKVFTDAT
jgi:transcriptional regulator with XRE-family HTH domain